ncbi:MAG TPA: alpha/beta fold hydrolase [Actinomycetota bacterium]|jgi:pimeloyl-ACP methyl ester carboxylesterase|nr:alpha/beta fold hydrolase [Actinomycetota bacterium]
MVTPQRLLSRPYRVPTAVFRIGAEDGVELAGARLGSGAPSLVFCHGFLGWHRKRKVGAFAERLARSFTVYVFDFRGHGESGGVCTYGDCEVFDVDAVVRLARTETGGPVATVGISMGGTAVVRHAALRGGVDAVVSISAPASWDGHGSLSFRRLRMLTETRAGRRAARWAGYRLTDRWEPPEAPEEVVERIAPTPLVVVHGIDDHFFDVEEARRLYRRAGEPKRLMLSSRFGHAEDGLTASFADRLTDRIHEMLGPR